MVSGWVNIVGEMVMREALHGYTGGFKIGGRTVTNLRYADDIVLIAGSEVELLQNSRWAVTDFERL